MLSSLLAVLMLSAGPAASGVEPSTPTVQELTPIKMRTEADEGTAAMRGSLKRVLQMLEKARTARDIVLLTCLNEKLTQIKALMRVGEQSNVTLQEFLAKDQVEGATHERRKIGLAREKVKQLTLDAETCLGESGANSGKTIVTVEKPDYPGDPTGLDTPEDPGLDPPPSASPYN